jgi:hypothetical protein
MTNEKLWYVYVNLNRWIRQSYSMGEPAYIPEALGDRSILILSRREGKG